MFRIAVTAAFLLSLAGSHGFADHHLEGEAKVDVHPVLVEVKSQLGKRSPDRPFALMVNLKAKAGQASKIVAAMKKATPPTRSEDGNTAYVLLQSPTDNQSFVIYERWKSLKALDAHLKQPYIVELLAEFEAALEDAPALSVMKPVAFGKKK